MRRSFAFTVEHGLTEYKTENRHSQSPRRLSRIRDGIHIQFTHLPVFGPHIKEMLDFTTALYPALTAVLAVLVSTMGFLSSKWSPKDKVCALKIQTSHFNAFFSTVMLLVAVPGSGLRLQMSW